MRRIASVVPLVLGLVLAPGAAAQSIPESVPYELVRGLLGGATVAVGQLPDGIPRDLLPPGDVVVLGGAAYPGGRSTGVVALPVPPLEAIAAFRARMEQAGGWRRPAAEMRDRGGFVMSPAMERDVSFCREGAYVRAAAFPRDGGGSQLRLIVEHDGARTYCGPGPEAGGRAQLSDVPFPELREPEGARTSSVSGIASTSNGDTEERSSMARMSTALGPGELLAHYAAELRRAGWTVRTTAGGEGVGVLTAETRDEQGRSWRGALTATALPGTARDVSFRVIRWLPGRSAVAPR